MPGPGAEPLSQEEIERRIVEQRRRNESAFIPIVVGLCLVAVPLTIWRIRSLPAIGGWGIVALEVVFASTYLCAALYSRRRAIDVAWVWVMATLEVTLVSAILAIDARRDAVFSLTNSTAFVYAAVVAASGIRLMPSLCLYSGALAAAEQLAVYLVFVGLHTDDIALQPTFMVFRSMFLMFAGLAGWQMAKSLRLLVVDVAHEAAERARVRGAFGTYVAEQVVDKVLSGGFQPERRAITVMFVDIRGFTKLSETKDPSELVRLLNTALDAFATAIESQHGIVNKFLGDGLMAIFGAPEPRPDHVTCAARAALAVADVSAQMRTDGRFPDLAIGIGIHTGEVVVGDVGGQRRREYTAIGDVVNVASRVESLNKELGTTILVTSTVKEGLRGFDCELDRHPPMAIRGRTAPVEVFELVRPRTGTLATVKPI